MTQILVVKPDTLNQRDRAALRRAGVVCVEAADPSEVRLIGTEGPPLSGSDMLFAAVTAINEVGSAADVRNAFAKAMFAILTDARAEREQA